jgi:hypothetical protein
MGVTPAQTFDNVTHVEVLPPIPSSASVSRCIKIRWSSLPAPLAIPAPPVHSDQSIEAKRDVHQVLNACVFARLIPMTDQKHQRVPD